VRQVEKEILDSLEVAVKTKYAGPYALNPESLLLNVIMTQVCECDMVMDTMTVVLSERPKYS